MTGCPQGDGFRDCTLRCKYNRFEQGELRIDSWELKCLDCGLRQTVAYRSDDEEPPTDAPDVCPFCTLCASGAGTQLCCP